jgi:hypothetical protein
VLRGDGTQDVNIIIIEHIRNSQRAVPAAQELGLRQEEHIRVQVHADLLQ